MVHSVPHKSSFVIHKSEHLSVLPSIFYMVQWSLDLPSHILHSIFLGSLSILLGEQVLLWVVFHSSLQTVQAGLLWQAGNMKQLHLQITLLHGPWLCENLLFFSHWKHLCMTLIEQTLDSGAEITIPIFILDTLRLSFRQEDLHQGGQFSSTVEMCVFRKKKTGTPEVPVSIRYIRNPLN